MELAAFGSDHIDIFLNGAGAEGWISERWEIEFLLRNQPAGCLVCLAEGKAVAFITAIRYLRSAWIGNLLVLPGYRHRGIGRYLMTEVLRGLDDSGCGTVWLTASSDGAYLYRTLGFGEVDMVQRWKASGVLMNRVGQDTSSVEAAIVDSLGWGDDRTVIFAQRPPGSGYFMDHAGFLFSMEMTAGQQIGPWGATCREAAERLLDKVFTGGDGSVFLDAPANNLVVGELLSAKGFTVNGSTLLMYRGRVPHYRAEYVYALASMGSYG